MVVQFHRRNAPARFDVIQSTRGVYFFDELTRVVHRPSTRPAAASGDADPNHRRHPQGARRKRTGPARGLRTAPAQLDVLRAREPRHGVGSSGPGSPGWVVTDGGARGAWVSSGREWDARTL